MKKISLLAVALTPFIGVSVLSAQDDGVATDPIGYVKLDLQPGVQAVGAALNNPAVAAGRIESNTDSSITLEGDHGLDLAAGHYVEVTGDGPFAGDRFEVDSASDSIISVNTASPNNTVDLGSVDLSGESLLVRPHVTLAQLFPPAELTVGDQVFILNPETGGYNTFTLEDDPFGGDPFWDRGGDQNELAVGPGQGMLFRNTSDTATELFTVMGEVRTNHFRQPLDEGLNQIAEGHPVDHSPNSRLMTQENGFEVGDQIFVFNPGTGGWDTYTFEPDPFGGDPFWDRGGDQSDTVFLFADKSVIVNKGTADPDYEAPKTF